jgi:threonine dehydrogenase-like Zn-dependent dehydrogenase
MIDFSKLRVRTAEERQAADQRAAQQEIAADRKKREEYASKTLALTLTHDAEMRFIVNGCAIIMSGKDDQRRENRAVFYAPSDFSCDAVDQIVRTLAEGATVTLAGYWKKREFNGKPHFEFVAQFITLADGATHPARS